MKKISLLKATLLISAFVFFTAGNAFAIPILQLYIDGSTYNSATETWETPSSSFTLWAIGNVNGPGSKGTITDVFLAAAYDSTETGSITLSPTRTTLLSDPSTPSDPSLVGVYSDTTPVLGDGTTSLGAHGIYGSGTDWYKFALGNFNQTDSPIGDFINSYPTSFTANAGQINAYTIDVTGYSSVHFDLYDHVGSATHIKYKFAPYSHDAEGGNSSPVPEPATMSLLGLGLAGLLGFRKRK